MRSLSVFHVQAIFAAAVALLILCGIGSALGEDIQFYGDDGSIFTITITGGCYTFKPNWDKKAVAGEIDRGCFNVWDAPGCRGEKRELSKGSEGLRDFNLINFNKKISSVSLCSPEGQGRETTTLGQSGDISGQRETTSVSNKGPTGPSGPVTLDSNIMQQIRDAAVSEHNKYRAKHGSPPLQGDTSMHDEAQKYAEYLAATNKFELNRNSRFIGNIASSVRTNPEDAIKDAVGRWYDGVNYYDFNNPGFSRQAGSFTASIWKNSTHMGIGAAWNQFQNNWVIISYYAPSPNLQGAFRENVLPFST